MTIAKIYYDTNSIEPVIYMNDAVRHYLDRNKKEISRINFELFSKFFKYISKIIKMENPNKNEVKKLKKELTKEEYVASKDWLTKKLDDMLL